MGDSTPEHASPPMATMDANIFSFVAPTEFVRLPSEGRYYPSDHPLYNQTTVEISNYHNLWADHKRTKFEKIIYEKEAEKIFPYKIFIYFDDKVFKLEQN